MNASSPLLLIGVGSAGAKIARGITHAFGGGLRHVLADTDASSASENEPFVLLGGDRLSGHGTGGDLVAGRLAAEDSIAALDDHLEGVRVAVIVTALGGGTGGGATLEAASHLSARGIPAIVFATTPFTFEGEDRQRNARGVMSMIQSAANATFFLPLDKLIGGTDRMDEAMQRAIDTLASGITLFWRLVEKPGYLAFDAERLRHLLSSAGRGRFATATARGPDRVREALDALLASELLASSSGPVRSAFCGILAGEDLRLSEVGAIADGVRGAFGGLTFDLATVNDEATFAGRLSVVVMLFEATGEKADDEKPSGGVMGSRRRRALNPLAVGQNARGRFKNAEPTIWNGEDLDVPTFARRNISLDF